MLTSMKGEINNNTIIVGDLNTPLTPMDRSTKQKINKETQTLNATIDQLDLIYERLLLNHANTPGFLAPGGEEFNPGPETRLDRSEVLCSKVLLKYKGDRESF